MMEDVLILRQIDSRQDITDYQLPDTIPNNIALTERPPKQQAVDAHISRFKPRTQNDDKHAQ